MKILTRTERLMRDIADRRALGQPVAGRALPRGHQWTGKDMPGKGGAAARRLRQAERLKSPQTADSKGDAGDEK